MIAPGPRGSARVAVADLPQSLQADVSAFAHGDDLDRFRHLCEEIRTLGSSERIDVGVIFTEEQLKLADFRVRSLVEDKRKQRQDLNRLSKSPTNLRPCQVWLDFGTGAVGSRFYMSHLCDIVDICGYPNALERLNEARDKRKHSTGKSYKGVDRKRDRVAHDGEAVLKELQETTRRYTTRGKKRKREVAAGVSRRDEVEGADTSDADTDISIERARGGLPQPTHDGHIWPSYEDTTEDGGAGYAWSTDADDTIRDIGMGDSVLSMGDLEPASGALLPVDSQDRGRVAHGPSLDSVSRDIEASALMPSLQVPGPSPSPQEQQQCPTKRSCQKSTARSLSMRATANEVIDVDSIPDSPSDGKPSDCLIESALSSLGREQWLTTEAVYSVAKLFNPDILKWFIAEPITTMTKRLREGGRTRKVRLLQDSHQYVVVFVHVAGIHWTAGVMCRPDRTIRIHDSLQNQQYIRESQLAMQDLADDLPAFPSTDSEPDKPWTCYEVHNSLRQTDDFNCGIYAIVFAICEMHGKKLPPSILPQVWRDTLSWGLRARLGQEHDCACARNEARHHPAAADGLVPGTSVTPPHNFSFEEVRRKVKAVAVDWKDAQRRGDECGWIRQLVEDVHQAREGEQRRLESLRESFRAQLALLGEPLMKHGDFLPTIDLACLRELSVMKTHVSRDLAAQRTAMRSAESQRRRLKEEARLGANREIESW